MRHQEGGVFLFTNDHDDIITVANAAAEISSPTAAWMEDPSLSAESYRDSLAQGIRRSLGQADQRVIRFAVRRLTDCQVEGKWPPKGVSQAVKLTGEPAPRAAKSASMSPPFPPAAETWARTVVLSML